MRWAPVWLPLMHGGLGEGNGDGQARGAVGAAGKGHRQSPAPHMQLATMCCRAPAMLTSFPLPPPRPPEESDVFGEE